MSSCFHQGGNREEEISELEASLERLRSERMRRSAEKHEAGPSGVGHSQVPRLTWMKGWVGEPD